MSLPLTLMTFGLFGLVINGVLLAITAGLTDSLDVGGFFATILAALVISIVTAVLLFVVGRMFGETAVGRSRTGRLGSTPPGTTGAVCSALGAPGRRQHLEHEEHHAVTSTNVNAVPPVGWSCAR